MATATAVPLLTDTSDLDLALPSNANLPQEHSGVRMTRELASEAWDAKRDAFSQKVRMHAWDRLDARHHENKARIEIPYNDKVFMLSGDRGSGKTLIAAIMAAQCYEQGMEVFSSASLLFGYRIDPLDVFTMAESLPDNCFVFLDEVHGLADRYAEHSTRQRTLSNSLALLRKKGIRLVMATVHEDRTAFSLKGQVQFILYPRQYRPRSLSKRGRKQSRRFPKWCHVFMSQLGPNPFEGRRLADQWDIPRTTGKCLRRDLPPLPPRQLWEAAKLMDSWAKPSIAQGISTTAAAVRQRLDEGVGGAQDATAQYEQDKADLMDLLKYVAEAINTGGLDVENERTIPWKRLVNAARSCGYKGTDKQARQLLRDFVQTTSQYAVVIEGLMKWFKSAGDEARSKG